MALLGTFVHDPSDATAAGLAERLRPWLAPVRAGGDPDAPVVVRWGTPDGPDAGRFVLNGRAALANLASPADRTSLWRLSGLGPLRRGRVVAIFRVYMCNLRAVRIFRRSGGRFREVRYPPRRAEPVVRAAARALHALGLDFGVATVGLSATGRAVAYAVDAAPDIRGNLLDDYAAAILDYARLLGDLAERRGRVWPAPNGSPILLGADPEFMLRDASGRMVPASRYFPRQGTVGCDARYVRRTELVYPLAEVRPEPQPEPLDLVRQIRRCLHRATTMVPNRQLRWVAGSMPFAGFPIGGHIHFSNLPLTTKLLRAFDNYLAIPVMLVERARTAVRRRARYGFLGDYRLQPHGFEYRTLGSWLVSPQVATAVLCLAKLIATNYEALNREFLAGRESHAAFYRCHKEYFRAIFPELWSEVAGIPSYGRYEEHLTPILNLVQTGRRWSEETDLRRRWGLA